ncbi:MAG: AAA family ATPase [Actinomycetota bacterium]|nr:AAA family ATPase [Actinomycetota bacterium]
MPDAERKIATILFADLVGSTAAASGQDPERTRVTLERFYEAMAAEIERAGGTVEKFAGDAVMAVFGVPTAHEDDAERALHAALAMQRRLGELFGEELALRVGVNTGDVVVGAAREASSFVSGDAVNVAARLEQGAGAGEILVGERTASVVRGAFEFDEATTVEARGKADGIPARRLVRALSLMRTRGVGGLASSFVGRDRELERLLEAYRSAVGERRPRLVTILGDAGVGKTRLVRELWERLGAESPEPLRRTGRCLSYGEATTYWPLAEVLREHFGINENDPPETMLARLAGRELLGLALGLDVVGGLHPLAVRDRFQDAWVDFLTEIAAERPVVLLVEDIHWADDPLLDVLEELISDVRGPLLLIATARPELRDRRPKPGSPSAELIELEPLSAEDSLRMLAELMAGGLPPELGHVVVERAEGNPFFVEELLGMLIDRSLLARVDGRWALEELPDDFSVPDSVQAVLAARIDLLAPAEKEALQAAAVIGRVFWAGPVYELVEGRPDLRLLEERDLIRRRPGSTLAGDREYAIKHALTREVAYATLPKAKRARLHAAFADWIERTGQGRDEHAPMLAHHLAEAVRPEDADLAWSAHPEERERLREAALAWLQRAADLAAGRYEIDEALALLHRALELESSEEARSGLWRSIGRTYALKFDGENFWTAMQNAFKGCRDRMIQGELYAELAFETAIRSGMWKRMPDPKLVQEWIAKAVELTEPESRARVKALIASARWNPVDGAAAAIEASALAEGLGDPELRSSAFDVRGITAFVSGEYDLGRAWEERRFELIDEISDPDHQAEIYASPISGCIWTGRFREARRLAGKHDEIASRLTPHHRMHAVAIPLEIEELAGRWDAIRALEQRAEGAVADNVATPCVRNPRSLLVCAIANVHGGDLDRAREQEERAQGMWMEGYGSTLNAPLLRLRLARGELDEIEELIEAPELRGWHRGWFIFSALTAQLDAFAALGDGPRAEQAAEPHLRRGTYLEPFALRALGSVREDKRLLEQAVAAFEGLGLDWHAAETKKLVLQA